MKIILKWVPSHINIAENEAADSLTKKGTLSQSKSLKLAFSTVKRRVNLAFKRGQW